MKFFLVAAPYLAAQLSRGADRWRAGPAIIIISLSSCLLPGAPPHHCAHSSANRPV